MDILKALIDLEIIKEKWIPLAQAGDLMAQEIIRLKVKGAVKEGLISEEELAALRESLGFELSERQ